MTQILVTSHREDLLRLLAGQEVLENHHADLDCQRVILHGLVEFALGGEGDAAVVVRLRVFVLGERRVVVGRRGAKGLGRITDLGDDFLRARRSGAL